MIRWFESTFGSLKVRSFRILWFGTIGSFVAFFMSMIVQSVVAFEITGTNTAVGLVLTAQGAGTAGFGAIGGAYADRWAKRRVVVICQLATALVLSLVAWLVHRQALTIEMLSVAAFVMGAAFAFLGPARQSLVVDLVPEARRGNAMAVSMIANTASRVFGPVVAGAFLGWSIGGATGAYVCMAVLYAASALSMAWIPKSIVRADAQAVSVLASVVAGFRYVFRQPRLRLLLGFFVAVILIGLPHVTVLPGLLENVYGIDSTRVSQLFFVSASGAVVASVSVARFADSARALPIYSVMAVMFGVGLVGLAWAPDLDGATACMFLVGVGSGGFQALNVAVIAKETEPEFMGRVMSLTMLAFAGFALIALPIGMLADRIGEQKTLTGMGVAVLLVAAAFGSALARHRDPAR